MNQLTTSRTLLTAVLAGGSVMSFLLDWSPNHLLNPLWHPHARFHSAVLLFLFAGVAATATWMLWRSSAEPVLAIKAAAFLSASYWTPFFFVPFLLPGSSWWAGIPGHQPRIAGVVIYPNLIVVGIFLLVTLYALRLGTNAARQLALVSNDFTARPTSASTAAR
ncbi:MAG: hypothetical protein M3O31_17440 [Acidobacteriota bacterium]|nr:hypothetical protein [Acidobacteriota bacterium]